MIIFFHKTAIWNKEKKNILVFGQYKKIKPAEIIITSKNKINYKIIYCKERPDFYIKIKGDISKNTKFNIKFKFKNKSTIKYNNIKFKFPFNNKFELNKNKSAIISTMCKNYSHRLDEWINYHLKLGFSGIVIFNNESNISNKINEPTENCVTEKSMKDIVNKYKDKVLFIDFPYTPINDMHYDNIQRISLSLSVCAFRNKCKFISLTDADEFIYIPETPHMNIENFLSKYKTGITIKSNILTNKNNDDVINNNIIDIARFVGENKYTKTILNTRILDKNKFIITSHNHSKSITLEKDKIIHYHCWINSRYNYDDSMHEINYLQNFLNG
jgi:hypothetical protein